jgi:RND superfamily putative drug exporter
VPATDGTGARVYLGSQTAADIDFADVFPARPPVFIGAVLLLSFRLLLVVFRSILVPLKAVVRKPKLPRTWPRERGSECAKRPLM